MNPTPTALPPQGTATPAANLRMALQGRPILPFIGIYDAFSAGIAGRHYDALFLSGFGFAASHYGLPDIGLIAWTDLLGLVQRVRAILPFHHLMVDIDDGYGDADMAVHLTRQLRGAGASGIVIEDQRRPRRCGHLEGKEVLPMADYLSKLRAVLGACGDLFVVARTDATDPAEAGRRALAYAAAGADAVLVEAVRDLRFLQDLSGRIDCPLVFNQIAGGQSPRASLAELAAVGVRLVHYSTPCLFAAQDAMEGALRRLRGDGGRLPDPVPGGSDVRSCSEVLEGNRQGRLPPLGDPAAV